METSKRSFLLAVISLVWLTAVTALYYVTHKPFDTTFAVQGILILWRLLVVCLIVSVSGGVGRRLVALDRFHPLVGAAVQGALGLGIFALIILGLGSFLGLSGWVLWGAWIFPAVFFRKDIFGWWGSFRSLRQNWKTADRLNKVFGVYLVLVLGMALLAAVAPPTRFDALVYHLVLPKAYLAEGRVMYFPWLMMTGMPQTAEMLYTWAIGLSGGLSAATILSWSVGLLVAAGLFGYVHSYLGERPASVAAVCLLSGFSLVVSLAWGYVDWLTILFGLAFLVSVDQWSYTGERKFLILTGAFAGFALGTKMPAGFLAVIGLAIVFWLAIRTKQNPLLAVVIFGLSVTLASLPWWIKNFVTTGNPFYPLLFPSGAMTEARLRVFQNAPTWGNWTDIFLLPLRATYIGIEGGEGYNYSIGPLLLGLAVFAWIDRKNVSDGWRNTRRIASALAVLGIAFWAVGNQVSGFLIQTRMYLAVFPAICVLAAEGYQAVSNLRIPSVRLNRIVNSVIILVLALNLVEVGSHTLAQGALRYVFGQQTADNYLESNLGSYAPAMAAINALPETGKALLLIEPRSLYCYPKCRPDETLDRWPRDWGQWQDRDQIVNAWKAEGFTHVLYYKAGAEFLRETKDINHTEEQWAALDSFMKTLPEPVDFNGVYELYSLH